MSHTIADLEAWAQVVLDDIREQTGWALDDFAIMVRRDSRATRKLGKACLGWPVRKLYLYHATLKDWHETAIEDIVRHEVAHFVAYDVHDDKKHGYWWKRIAEQIGARPYANGEEVDRIAYAATKISGVTLVEGPRE